MSHREDKDSNLTKQDLLDFKVWLERKFDQLPKQTVTVVPEAVGQKEANSTRFAGLEFMEANPPSDFYDSQMESTSTQRSFDKEASKPLKNLEPGDSSIEQMLQKMLDRQEKMESQISAVNDTLKEEKQFMRDQLQNAQGNIMKLLENIEHQTTHFEKKFHELAMGLDDKVDETRKVTESQTSECVEAMTQIVREITSKVEQEIKTVQACVQQCQLSTNKQDLNIPDLKVMMEEVLKDVLNPIEKAVEMSVKGQVTGHFAWLETQIHNHMEEIKTYLEEQKSQSTSFLNDLNNSMPNAHLEIQEKISQSETKQEQSLGDSEKTMQENFNTVTARLEQNLTHQIKEGQEQLEKLVPLTMKQDIEELKVKLDGLSSKLADQEAANTERSENNKQHLETKVQELQGSSQSIQVNIETQIIQSVAQMTEEIQKSGNFVKTKVTQNLEETEERIIEKTNIATDRLEENLTRQSQGREEQLKAYMAVQIQKSEQSLETKLSQNLRETEKRITENINTITAGLEKNLTQQSQKSEKCLRDEMEKVKGETIQQIKQATNESCQNIKREIQANMKTNTETMKDFMTRVKRQIFQFVMKESSITRLKLADPTIQVRSSTFDFYVENFKDLVKSGKNVYSAPWYIDEFQSTLVGNVVFKENGETEVWLLYACHPREMGLKPRCGKLLKIKATITDRSGVLPDLLVGEKTLNCDEEIIKTNGDWRIHLGTLKCEDVVQNNYDKCNDYWYDSVFVRYHIDFV